MKVILDTHVLVWSFGMPERLSARVREVLEDPRSELVWSAVGTVELALKVAQGKMRPEPSLEAFLAEQQAILQLEFLPVEHRHALCLATLTAVHGDPFDRLLVAQARVEGVPLLSRDRVLSEYGIEVIW